MLKKELEDKIKSLTTGLEDTRKQFRENWTAAIETQASMFQYMDELEVEIKVLYTLIEMEDYKKEE